MSGCFFALDWRCVEDATRYGDGINTALAYIALARFTRANHRNTIAGATAICTRLGLTRARGDLALKNLESAGLISPTTKGTARSINDGSMMNQGWKKESRYMFRSLRERASLRSAIIFSGI